MARLTERGKALAKIAKARYMAKKGKHASRILHLKERYGITLEELNQLIQNQRGLCAICSKPFDESVRSGKAAVVDHDHATGALRGILHRQCNSALGVLGDSVEGLTAALNYLENHHANPTGIRPAADAGPCSCKNLD